MIQHVKLGTEFPTLTRFKNWEVNVRAGGKHPDLFTEICAV